MSDNPDFAAQDADQPEPPEDLGEREFAKMPLGDADTPLMPPLEHEVERATLADDDTVVGEPGQEPSGGRQLVFAQLSDPGRARPNNQDAVFGMVCGGVSSHGHPSCGVFIVADGMGGHVEGEKASAIAVDIMARAIVSDGVLPVLGAQPRGEDAASMAEVLHAAAELANRAVAEQVPEGGTTLTAAVVVGNLVYLAHVGDTRGYVIDEGRIEQITRDHSLVQRLVEMGQLTRDQAAEHNQRNVLYRALGQDETVDADIVVQPLWPGATLLVCSDGLWGLVEAQEMLDVVGDSATLLDACKELVRRANERGGPDNITVLLARMQD